MVATVAAPPVDRPAGPTLSVAEIIRIVQEWVDCEGCRLPGFAGAYLVGGITSLPLDAQFALYRDVDVAVVTTIGSKGFQKNLEQYYRGLMIEVGLIGLETYASPDMILADPAGGPDFSMTTIFADPLGVLEPLRRAVTAEFALQRWVRARCDVEKEWVREQLAAMRAATAADRLLPTLFFINNVCGVLALARLARPTHRRTLILLRKLLEEQGRLDLHERALEIWGSAGLSRAEVQALLDESAAIFGRAVEVVRTPVFGDFKLQPHLRPYLVDASQAMIDDGFPREATWWIGAAHWVYTTVLQNDAPEEEMPLYRAQAQDRDHMFGFSSEALWSKRIAMAEQLTDEIFRMADELVALIPE